ncbi:MAG: S41 family peptidase [Paludibacteraceae bacterium]
MKTRLSIFSTIAILLFACSENNITENTHKNVFDAFWQILDERYVYFEEKGVDWDSVRTVYRTKVHSVNSDEELETIIEDVLTLFQDPHLYVAVNETKVIEHRITHHYRGQNYASPADKYDFDTIRTHLFLEKKIFFTVQHRMKNYAYIDFIYLYDNNLQLIIDALKETNYKNGLIVDLRNGSSGHLKDVTDISSLFYSGKKNLFYSESKTGKGRNDFGKKIPYAYKGKDLVPESVPVVVLIDSVAYSAANILSFILDDFPNTVTIGTHTHGGGSPINSVPLPNGWMLTYPYQRFYSISGQSMEAGLEPDIQLVFKVDESGSKDAHIARALTVLDSINGFPKEDYENRYE